MKNLIPMTDFVLTEKYTATGHFNYAKFLKQQKQLWMFVPCDENNDPITEKHYQYFDNDDEYNDYLNQYQKAKERCLFEGFEYNKALFFKENKKLFWHGKLQGDVESLTNYNIKLTQTALKKLGL